MDKFIKVLCLILTVLMFVPTAADAGNRGKKKSSEVNWEPVINAIIQVESNGKCTAKNGNQCGAMQITPILVRECNDILKKKGCKKRYKLSDRFNLEKSKNIIYHFWENDKYKIYHIYCIHEIKSFYY